MKRLTLALIAALTLNAAMAIQAIKDPITFTQSDGSEITVQLIGDERFSTYMTMDRITLERVGDDFYYKTATGTSAVMAHNEGSRTQQEASFIAANRDMMTLEKIVEARATSMPLRAPAQAPSIKTAQVPPVGSPNIPIILVNFSDFALRNGANAKSIFESQFNTMEKSCLQYYKDNSREQFTPNFEILGPVTLPQTRSYYGKNVTRGDQYLGQMVADAVQLLPDEDWSRFDNDNDGTADVVIVLFAGPGEAQGATSNTIWPAQWDLYSASHYGDGPGIFKMGDTQICKFAVFNETSGSRDTGTATDGIGTFCHEFSHCLGLPDFYDTNYGGHYGMGTWSIMDSGCYNRVSKSGDTPCGYTAYEKNYLGWMPLTDAVTDTQYTLNPIDGNDGEAVKVVNSQSSNEYYIFEYRKKQGWNVSMKSEGLFAYHVTYSQSAWSGNTVNNYDLQRMTPICADNAWSTTSEQGDCYPYNGNDKITDTTTPKASLNEGTIKLMGKPVTEIAKTSGNVSFWYCKDYVKEIPVIEPVDESTITITAFACQWNAVDNALYYTLNVYSDDHSYDQTLDNLTVTSQTFTSLTPGTRYNLRVKATYSDGTMSAWSQVTTVGTKANPVMLQAEQSQVGSTQFTASWQPQDHVASYTLHVRKRTLADYDLLLHETFDKCTTTNTSNNIASSLSKYTDNTGWTGSYVYQNIGGVSLSSTSSAGKLVSPALDLSGYNGKVVVKVNAACISGGSGYTLQVNVDGTTQNITLPSTAAEDYTLIFETSGNTAGKVTFSASPKKKVVIYDIKIYSGNGEFVAQAAPSKAPVETGDHNERTITGIEGTSYTVSDLTAGGEYIYRVKALFSNGSESQWSNLESVLLGGNSYLPGDVNGDGEVNVLDINAVIEAILSGNTTYNGREDVNGDGEVNVLDANQIVGIILAN